ncbi:PucR family transcriptional regulator [Streptacidiphilus pinicola]|uniref:PucR family transcriptional regulator n=1 Tax=Streptacidiphilus pinicola TaxID=2219663 RepID=A0A2X0KFU0_9ACTN|nr:PucR family transcriptional regulator [Streptacidiphilus pinicola]RAG85959.1 PucR family transcriptional regulator [Streptacidiphilus pinicola]
MIIGDLLSLEDLRIEVAWATSDQLAREVTGVTSTDLQDPARYLRPGELVLTGLVWWRPDELAADPVAAAQAAGRFATALRSAEAAGLLAGEGTHGAVPAELADACRRHDIPLLAVPAGTSFRAVTDRVYLRLWGELQHQAEDAATVPAAVRRDLLTLRHSGATPSELLTRAVTDLGLPHCSLLTSAGRLLGTSDPAASTSGTRVQRTTAEPNRRSGPGRPRTGSAARSAGRRTGLGEAGAPDAPRGSHVPQDVAEVAALAVGEPGVTPFDGWLLRPHSAPAPAAAAVLRGLAELLAPLAAHAHSTSAAQRQGGARVVDLLRGPARGHAGGDRSDAGLAEALHSCGLPADAALTPVVARVAHRPAAWAAVALAEALQEIDAPFVVAPDPNGTEPGRATGLCAAPEALVTRALEESWPGLRTALTAPRTAQDGISTQQSGFAAAVGPCSAPGLDSLRRALTQADWTIDSLPADGVAGSETLDSLAALLRGVPAGVRDAYRERLLGPLHAHDQVNPVSLLETLAVFLELDGSWSRAARVLHVHVNTVHYRVRRIEELTGRSLARLEDRADLLAALLCDPLFN